MFDRAYTRSATPLAPSVYGYMRVWLGTSPKVPAAPYLGALPPTPQQALLLLSLSCTARLTPAELAQIRRDALLDEDGCPRNCIRIRAETTKWGLSRKIPMPPDIRRDAMAFQCRHPDEQYVAFIRRQSDCEGASLMSPHGLQQWFRSVFRAAKVGVAGGSAENRLFPKAIGA